MRLKICDSRFTCKIANKYLNVRERVEVVERNKKTAPSLPLLSCELSVSVKENPDRKKNHVETKQLICNVNQLTGFYMSGMLTWNRLIAAHNYR